MHANIDIRIRRLIGEFPGYGINYIGKLQSYCANMTRAEKIRYARIFQQVTHKGGESTMNYIKISQHAEALSVSIRNS